MRCKSRARSRSGHRGHILQYGHWQFQRRCRWWPAFGRVFTDPKGQITVFGQINQGPNFFFYTSLGTVQMGTPVRAALVWDQSNHQFLISWTDRVTGVKTKGTMPYSLNDTAPPTTPSGSLNVSTFPANCTANQTWVYMETEFDNVQIAK